MRGLTELQAANLRDEHGRLPTFKTERARRIARSVYEAIKENSKREADFGFGLIRGAIIAAVELGDPAVEHATRLLLQRFNEHGLTGLDEIFGAALAA